MDDRLQLGKVAPESVRAVGSLGQCGGCGTGAGPETGVEALHESQALLDHLASLVGIGPFPHEHCRAGGVLQELVPLRLIHGLNHLHQLDHSERQVFGTDLHLHLLPLEMRELLFR